LWSNWLQTAAAANCHGVEVSGDVGVLGHPDFFFFFDVCQNRRNPEEALSGIPDIQNSEIDEHLVEIVLVLPLARVQRSNAELMSHHTSSLVHASFFDDVVVDALLAPKCRLPLHYAALTCRCVVQSNLCPPSRHPPNHLRLMTGPGAYQPSASSLPFFTSPYIFSYLLACVKSYNW
jgi:hypothetical protein